MGVYVFPPFVENEYATIVFPPLNDGSANWIRAAPESGSMAVIVGGKGTVNGMALVIE
jgi:hypothetical protein